MDTRDLTLLAYGIATYGGVLESIEALRRVGQRVPYVLDQRIRAELMILTLRWSNTFGDVLADPESVVVEARRWLAEHGDVLNELTSREREEDAAVRDVEHGEVDGPTATTQ